MKYLLYFISSILVILITSDKVFSIDPNKLMSQHIHTVYQIEDGLPQNIIQCMLQTKDGYMCYGTQEGLVRFDGLNFIILDKYNTPEIKHNSIWCLYEDRSNNLWIGTDGGGLNRYNQGKFDHYSTKNGLSNDHILCIYEDKSGVLWIGTRGGGLNQFKEGVFTNFSTDKGLSNNVVFCILEDRNNVLWIGTRDGLNQFKDGKFTHLTSKNGLSYDKIFCLLEDKSGVLWIGTLGGGLDQYKDGMLSHINIDDGSSQNVIRDIYEDKNGVIWIGTDGGGLIEYKDGKYSHYTSKDGLSSDIISSVYEDDNRTLWVGTLGGGLNQYKDGKFSHLTTKEGLSNDIVFSIFEDDDNVLWIGTLNSGINKFKDNKFINYTIKDGLSSNMINSIYKNKNDVLFIGNREGFIDQYKNGKFSRLVTKEELSNDVVRSIYEDSSGVLWIGTRGSGLRLYKDGKLTCYTTKEGLTSDQIYSIFEDRKSNVWICTLGGGLNKFKDGNFIHYTTKEGLSCNTVLNTYEDQNGVLWISTIGGGLNRLKDEKITYYTTKEGIFDDTVFWIQEDNSNNLWMTSNKGIFKINIEEFNRYDRDSSYKIKCTVYGLSDGMLTKECNGGNTPAGWMSIKENKGNLRNYSGQIGEVKRLYFPTIKGVAYINPDNIKVNDLPPPVHIEYIKANERRVILENEEKDDSGRIVFNSERNNIYIKYTACSFDFPKAVKFRYILEGYDDEWKDAPYDLRFKEYTNLPLGQYKFKVIACNVDGFWNEKGDSVSFTIEPAYYQTYWFISVCILFFLSIIYLIFKYRIRIYEKQNRVLIEAKRKAEDANKIKSEFLKNVSHELITPLNGILGYCQLITFSNFSIEETNNLVQHIHSLGKHLLQLFQDILNLSQIESGKTVKTLSKIKIVNLVEEVKVLFIPQFEKKKLKFVINIQPNFPDEIYSDYVKLKQIIVNLIGNSLKFTETGFIELSLKIVHNKNQKQFLFAVKDTGIGIPLEKLHIIFDSFVQADGTTSRKYGGTGLGLAISRKLVELLGGEIWVESEIGKGSTFFFCIKS